MNRKSSYHRSVFTICVLLMLLSLGVFVGAAQPTRPPSRNYYVTPPKWSPDRSKIAIALDNFVEVRDAATTESLFTLNSHSETVTFVAFSPDSNMIATASTDQTVKLWDADNGALLRTLSGHNAMVTAVMWSPDGKYVLSSSFDTDPSLFVWDSDTGDLISTRDSGDLYDIAFRADGERLGVATALGIHALDTLTLEPIVSSPRVSCCPYIIYAMVWSPDGNYWATSTQNGLVLLWDANTGVLLKELVANSHYAADSRDVDNLGLSWVRAVAFSTDGTKIRADSGDGTLTEWDTLTGELLRTDQIGITAAAVWSPDAETLAAWELTTLEGIPTNDSPNQIARTSSLVGEMSIVIPFAGSNGE